MARCMSEECDVISTAEEKSVCLEWDKLDAVAYIFGTKGLRDQPEVAHHLTNGHAELMGVYQPCEFSTWLQPLMRED